MRAAAALAAVVAVAIVLVVGTGLGWWNGTPPAARAAPRLSVETSLTPRPAFFGDRLVAEVDVLVDPAASVRVEPVFTPFVARSAPAVTRARAGRLERRRYRYALECLTDACLPIARPRSVQLPPVHVTASIGGTTTAVWPSALIASRLEPADVAARKPPFRSPATPPPPAYRTDPGRLADWLTAGAGVLAAAGLALLALEGRRLVLRARRRRLASLGPLEAALLYTREAARRPDPRDRRKALGLLAETVGDEDLAGAAERLAWGEAPPSPERTLSLADDVERNGDDRG
jgi:hypothetical protein